MPPHRETATHVFFWRTESPFSQWHPSNFEYNGINYANAEQFMMASKAFLFKDTGIALSILQSAKTPAEMKTLGRKVKGFKRKVWDDNKFEIVVLGNYNKFNQNEQLKHVLLATGDKVLVEASAEDTIWGVGLAEDDPRVEDETQWRGENLLGRALMRVREEIRWEEEQQEAAKGRE